MRKIFIVSFLIMIFSTVAYGIEGLGLGMSFDKIKATFDDKNSGYMDNGLRYLDIDDSIDDVYVRHIFSKGNICIMVLITPHNQVALTRLVEVFNEQYIVVSNTEWKMYANGIVGLIKLNYNPDLDVYIFSVRMDI